MSTQQENVSCSTTKSGRSGSPSGMPRVTGTRLQGQPPARPRTPNPPPPRTTSPRPSAKSSANGSNSTTSPSSSSAVANAASQVPNIVLPNPIIVVHKAERSMNKNVHVADRKHRGSSRNDLGGFFTA